MVSIFTTLADSQIPCLQKIGHFKSFIKELVYKHFASFISMVIITNVAFICFAIMA
jgi:hypothetical protein